MKYKIIKKFLKPDSFEEIKNIIIHKDFPWRRRDHIANDDPFILIAAGYFSYGFYNNMDSNSELYRPHIVPILQKLGASAPIDVRANMSISELFKKSGWHRDHDFKCTTAILYLNDCDGGTELKINNKIIFIKADANKMIIFDTAILHRGTTSTNEPLRYIINFNYLTKENYEK